jgi:putative aldouronate transport system substrate-binding protein
MKKITALLMMAVMLVSLFAGCGKSAQKNDAKPENTSEKTTEVAKNTESAKVEKIKIWVPTSGKYDDIDAVMAKVNEITRAKIGVEVEFCPLQFGQWFGQYSLLLSGTEDVDIMANYGGYLNAYSQGACLDLTDLLNEYGQDIIATEGEYLKGGMIDGRQYAIPIYAAYAWNMGLIYRQDVVDELGLTDQVANVKTLEDWEPILAAVKEAKPDMTPYVMNTGATASNFQYGTWDDLGNNYGVLLDGGKTSEVVNLFESDEYARLCKIMYDWNQKGYSSKDIQTQTDGFGTLTQNDAAFSTLGQTDFNTKFYQTTSIGKPIGIVMLGDAVGRTYNNVTYTVMSNTKHPEACMKFLNLWFSDTELGNLIKYGIEGTHYVVNGDGMAEYPEGQDANSCTYHLGASVSNTVAIRWVTENPDYVKLLNDANSSARRSVALGFAFNTDSVTNEITQLDNVRAKYQTGLETGVMDPDQYLPEFNKALKDAGIDKVIAEKQAQLDAYLGK